MLIRRALIQLIRFSFRLFYNPFAFTYDFVSAVVSRGHWRDWTRAAIPRIAGARVLEIPCGTGNLLLDLYARGYRVVGVDLSASMLRISRQKFQRVQANVPLARAQAQALPFRDDSFDSVVMTFPPGFVFDPRAFAEMHRVLVENGRVIWVDAGRLLPRDVWSRLLNRAFDAIDGPTVEQQVESLLAPVGFKVKLEWVRDESSVVMVVTATKFLNQ